MKKPVKTFIIQPAGGTTVEELKATHYQKLDDYFFFYMNDEEIAIFYKPAAVMEETYATRF